jgi:hypothetical protein
MVEDQRAYEGLTAAKKLPEGSRERGDRLPAALLASITTPQAVGAAAAAILGLCDRLVDRVNFYLLSDLAVCADLAMATVRCAAYNVRVNLSDVGDAAEARPGTVKTGQSRKTMASDPRDYKLELSTAAAAAQGMPEDRTCGRPFLSVHFACCGAYQRVYRAADGKSYEGRCPRCARPVKFVVGEGGTPARCFVAR